MRKSLKEKNNIMTIQEITAQELKAQMDKGLIQLIDVREPMENAEERIPNAILLPLSSFEPAKALSLKKDKKLVIHCRSGKRSMQAAQKLAEAGCQEVYNLQGGIQAWIENGFQTLKSQNAPISLMRQVQISAGSLVVLGVILSYFVAQEFIFLSGFVGAGLVFAGITDTCALGMLLAKMPWNKTSNNTSCSIT